MQHCPLCNVNIAGNKKVCPLCGGPLSGQPDPESEVFPAPYKSKVSPNLVLGLIAVVSIAASAICVLINLATQSPTWWSLLVVGGCACAWTTAAIAIAHRRDLTQNIAWQVILITILSLLWDASTGWRGWSIDYVFPCACAAGLLTILLLVIILHLPVRTFSVPFIVCCLIGLIPAVLVACGNVTVAIPSIICSGMSIAMLASLLVFCWPMVKAELNRRLHI
ncbi:MAG: DUF6320 domain-containing protein [Clostridia bacterium]|nr:DUF6320 domain-containing protein [Clostridia bacterium]